MHAPRRLPLAFDQSIAALPDSGVLDVAIVEHATDVDDQAEAPSYAPTQTAVPNGVGCAVSSSGVVGAGISDRNHS